MSRTPENHTRCISPDQPYSPSYYPGSGEQDADVGAAACAAAAVGSKRKDDGATAACAAAAVGSKRKGDGATAACAAAAVGSKRKGDGATAACAASAVGSKRKDDGAEENAVGSKRKDDGAEQKAKQMQLPKSKKLRVDCDAAAASCVGSKVPEGMLDPFDEEILNGDREANLALKVCLSFLSSVAPDAWQTMLNNRCLAIDA